MSTSLNKLSFLLSGLLGRPVVLSGKKEAPFSMEITPKSGVQESWVNSLQINVQLPANRLKIMGISLDQIAAPMVIQKDQASFDINAVVNGGTLSLSSVMSLAHDSSIAVGQGMVLTDVRITQSLTDGLLTKLHPIFVGSTAGKGAVDLYLEKLDWPLTDGNINQPICDGYLNFNNVALKSAGMLEGLLSLLKAKRSNLSITSKNLGFSCQDGWIATTPLTLKTDDTVILLEGSMGFDQTLDFEAKTPITQKMVSAKVYPYLADSMIAIPISGTAENPQVDSHQFYATLANLVKEAGGKALRKETGDIIKDNTDRLLNQIFN